MKMFTYYIPSLEHAESNMTGSMYGDQSRKMFLTFY